MSAGITRLHGKAETGASSNLSGTKSSFFAGYQPLFVKISVANSTFNFVASYDTVDSNFEKVIKTCESVGTVVAYGIPATESSNSVVIVAYDYASVNQGDGTGGQSGATTGFGALKSALASIYSGSAGDFTLTSYTGFSGSSLN